MHKCAYGVLSVKASVSPSPNSVLINVLSNVYDIVSPMW